MAAKNRVIHEDEELFEWKHYSRISNWLLAFFEALECAPISHAKLKKLVGTNLSLNPTSLARVEALESGISLTVRFISLDRGENLFVSAYGREATWYVCAPNVRPRIPNLNKVGNRLEIESVHKLALAKLLDFAALHERTELG